MWQLEDLRKQNIPTTLINGTWVPARPLNSRKEYTSIIERLRDASLVFSGQAEAFMWPEDANSRPTQRAADCAPSRFSIISHRIKVFFLSGYWSRKTRNR